MNKDTGIDHVEDTGVEEPESVESVEDIDESLLAEFGIGVEEDKEEEETESTEEDEESEVGEEAPDEGAEVEEASEDLPQFDNDNQNQAFAQMRIAEREARERAEQYESIISALAEGTGYDNHEAFMEDVMNLQKQQYMEETGHSEETLAMQQQLMAREQQLMAREQAMQEQMFMEEATKFAEFVNTQAETYGIEPEEIYNRLEESGFHSPEEIVGAANNHLLVQGVLVDEIAKHKAKEVMNTEKNRPQVNSDPLYSTNNQPSTSDSELESLLKSSLTDDLVGF